MKKRIQNLPDPEKAVEKRIFQELTNMERYNLFTNKDKIRKLKCRKVKIQICKQQEKREERLVRILSKDIEGKMKVYPGLTKIKGVSWAFSNAVCKILKIDKNKTIGSLTEEEIQKISDFIKNPKLPDYIMNRRKDMETGKEKHLDRNRFRFKKRL